MEEVIEVTSERSQEPCPQSHQGQWLVRHLVSRK